MILQTPTTRQYGSIPETCACCGVDDPERKLYPPGEWVDYLQAERGLGTVEGVLAVPLCRACLDRYALLRSAYREFDHLDADQRESTRDRFRAALDDLDLEALRNETGPGPDDVGPVL